MARILGRHYVALVSMAIVGMLFAFFVTSFRVDRHDATAVFMLNPVNYQLGLWNDPIATSKAASSGRAIHQLTSRENVAFALRSLLPEDSLDHVFPLVERQLNGETRDSWASGNVTILEAPEKGETSLKIRIENGVPSATGALDWNWNPSTQCLESSGWRLLLDEKALGEPDLRIRVVAMARLVELVQLELRAHPAGAPDLLEVTYMDDDPKQAIVFLDAILDAFSHAERRRLEEQAKIIGKNIESERARIHEIFDIDSSARSELMSRNGTGTTFISLEAESLRLAKIDAQITSSNLRLNRLGLVAPSSTEKPIEALLDWEIDFPGALPVLEELAVAIGAENVDGTKELRAVLIAMATEATNREQRNLAGLAEERLAVQQRLKDLLMVEDEVSVMNASLSSMTEVLADLELRRQQTEATINTLPSSITRIEDVFFPVQVQRLTTTSISLLGGLGGLLLGIALATFLESRRRGIWTPQQVEEITDLPCVSGSRVELSSWIHKCFGSRSKGTGPAGLLFTWPTEDGAQAKSDAIANDLIGDVKQQDGGDFEVYRKTLDLPIMEDVSAAILVIMKGETDLASLQHCQQVLKENSWTLCGSVFVS